MRQQTQRGSVTLWAIVSVTVALIIMGLIVDGGAQMRAQQRADQVAREAARAAGQAVNGSPVLGRPGLVDVSRGRQAAEHYLTAAQVTGTVSVNGTNITVTTAIDFKPIMLSAIGIGSLTVTGQSTAETKQVYEGKEQ